MTDCHLYVGDGIGECCDSIFGNTADGCSTPVLVHAEAAGDNLGKFRNRWTINNAVSTLILYRWQSSSMYSPRLHTSIYNTGRMEIIYLTVVRVKPADENRLKIPPTLASLDCGCNAVAII